MGELKSLRKENLKLKEDLAAVNDEVQNLKTLLKQQRLQSEIECVGEPTKTYVAGIQKSVDFLSEDHHNAKDFRKKTLQELGKLSHKLAEISSKADNMAAAIDDLQKYSFQYNVKVSQICRKIMKRLKLPQNYVLNYFTQWERRELQQMILTLLIVCLQEDPTAIMQNLLFVNLFGDLLEKS